MKACDSWQLIQNLNLTQSRDLAMLGMVLHFGCIGQRAIPGHSSEESRNEYQPSDLDNKESIFHTHLASSYAASSGIAPADAAQYWPPEKVSPHIRLFATDTTTPERSTFIVALNGVSGERRHTIMISRLAALVISDYLIRHRALR